jgi:hypothetical protein
VIRRSIEERKAIGRRFDSGLRNCVDEADREALAASFGIPLRTLYVYRQVALNPPVPRAPPLSSASKVAAWRARNPDKARRQSREAARRRRARSTGVRDAEKAARAILGLPPRQ